MNNPSFNNARGSASSLQLVPPFSFQDMTVMVFPLRANLSQLTRFCDQYLNQDSELVQFQPFMPYVYLMVLDYGKMSVEAANMGWVSQCEVAFSVPLRWMVKNNGAWEFHEWAVNCPFIYVDNELSMTTGREVYGWPKVLAHIDPTISDWIGDPHGSRTVFQIKTSTIGKVYRGEEATPRPFLSVHQNPTPSFLDTPTDLRGLLDPLTRLPNTALGLTQFGLDMCKTFSGIAMEGVAGSAKFPDLFDPNFYKKQFSPENSGNWMDPNAWEDGLRGLLWSLFPRMYMNTVNLKQFRDAASPWNACYQAVTNSRMKYDSINGVGPLGQQNLAFGQYDGGYHIDIHRYGSQPVVDALGLIPSSSYTDGDVSVATLRPTLPFWLKVDMTYSRGQTVTWRSHTNKWREGEGLREILSNEQDTAKPEDIDDDDNDDLFKPIPLTKSSRYNTARGAAIQEASGPFSLPNTTIRVLPLIADETTLGKFVQEYLNIAGETRFEAWGSHVYLIVYNFTQRSSDADAAGLYSGREVNFAVPVRQFHWYEDDAYDLTTEHGRAKRDAEKFATAALVTPFAYVDDASVAITSTEVNGVPTLSSEVGSPAHTWMDSSGPEAGQNLLRTSALVLPTLGVGAGASHKSFLDIGTDKIFPYSDIPNWRRVAHGWGPALVEDLRRKYRERGWRDEQKSESQSFRRMRALALEAITGKLCINNITLKQFRDAWQPDQACYQALVQGRKKIEHLHEVHEIREELNVWIKKYPTQPVSEVLGLQPKHTYPGNEVEVFEAIRPFWLRADVVEELGQTLFERVGTTKWTRRQQPDQLAGWRGIALDDIHLYAADQLARISYFQRKLGLWVRVVRSLNDGMEGVTKIDIDAVRQLETSGKLRNLQISSRVQPRPIMNHFPTLNHIDRVHVPDLGAFLNARQGDELNNTSSEQLGVDFGNVAPATVVDSIISRQWACPETHRRKTHKADFGVNVDTLGKIYDKTLFPLNERRGNFWPQSGDDQVATENQRKGLAWQLWDDVWKLIESGDNSHNNLNQTKDNPTPYRTKAEECLPAWFRPGKAQKPGEWRAEEWNQIADGLRQLVDWSHYKVDWNQIIRKLDEWQKVAMQMHAQLAIEPKPDPIGQPEHDKQPAIAPNVAQVLSKRLHDIAES